MKPPVPSLAKEVLTGSRRALAKAITLLESRRPQDRALSDALLQALTPHAGKSLRLGVSGSPGVGKSTFIESIGKIILREGHRLAVLAVDPTSPVSGGSILGDRVRMEELSKDERVFIRPSPSGTTLGGVARHTRESILACESAGYDVVLVETVGVGQSETVVASMVDLLLILHLPNSGDEIQGMKKGILELADLVAVTKADGEHLKEARLAKMQLEQALSFTAREGEAPPVLAISSTEATGLDALWLAAKELLQRRRSSGTFQQRRTDQSVLWFRSELGELLQERLRTDPVLARQIVDIEKAVGTGRLAASTAASQILDQVFKGRS